MGKKLLKKSFKSIFVVFLFLKNQWGLDFLYIYGWPKHDVKVGVWFLL
jgi:hypothetical protein